MISIAESHPIYENQKIVEEFEKESDVSPVNEIFNKKVNEYSAGTGKPEF